MGKPRLQYRLEFYAFMTLLVASMLCAVGISVVYWAKPIVPTRVKKLAAPEQENTIGLLPAKELIAGALGRWTPVEDVERVNKKPKRGVQVYNRGGVGGLRTHQICLIGKGDKFTVIGISSGKERVLLYLLESGGVARSELSCPEKTVFPVYIDWLGDNRFLEEAWRK